MRRITSVNLDESVIRALDDSELSKNISRSGIVRIALSEFLEREKGRKENQYGDEKGEK